MKFKFKYLAVSMLALLLCGCNNSSSSSTPEPEPEDPPIEPDPTVDDYYEEAIKGYTPLEKIDVDSFDRKYTKVDSDGVYVRKVNNLTDQNYILGIDASSVLAEEASGVKYYDFEGNEADVFKVMSDSGVNYIRVRVWNDPFDKDGNGYGGGNNDINAALEIGKRATKYNMSLLVDFHYSDFWADPSKQMAPKAWADMIDIDEKSEALYQFTKSSLELLKENNVVVGMVQVGNETNGGKMAGETAWRDTATLMNSGSKAVREVYPDALVALHFANPEKFENYIKWAKEVKNVDYDVFGSSFYPYWHGTLDNLSKTLSTIAATYNKRVMVLETSYAYCTEDTDASGGNQIGEGSGYDKKDYPFTMHGQVNNIVDVLDTMVNKTINGLGICYWEGAWISVNPKGTKEDNQKLWEKYGSGWASSYAKDYDPNDAGKFYGGCAVENQALFDEYGHPLESLKAFNLVRFGNEIENEVDGVNDIELIKYDNEEFTLPETVEAVYRDNSKQAIPVEWESFDIEAAKLKGNGKYSIKGTAGGFTVYCNLRIMEYNYVQNYSFETGSHSKWKLKTDDVLSATHIIKVTNENPQTGKFAFHFWTSDAEGVKFELTQDFTDLKAANYKLQASFLGGGSGTDSITASKQNIYIYIAVNGTIVKQQSHTIKNWNDGYKDALLKGVKYTSGKLTIGIHVEISEANCWGDIDDVMLNVDGN